MLFNLKSLALRQLFSYFNKTPLLGLDLGWRELRYLQLQKKGKGFHIEKVGVFPISRDALEEQLSAWVAQAGLSGYELALALPGQALIKKIEISGHFSQAELANELKFRLCQYFPGLAEHEIQFDYVLREAKEAKQKIILVAAKKEELHNQIKIFNKVGMKVKVVDADLYALARAYLRLAYSDFDPNHPHAALLDLRWPLSSFLVFDREDLVFHHQWRIDESLLLQQVKSVWQLFQANHSKLKIRCLGLAGELPELEQRASQFEEALLLPVKVINPFQGLSCASDGDLKLVKQLGPRFLLCCGLALRGCPYD